MPTITIYLTDEETKVWFGIPDKKTWIHNHLINNNDDTIPSPNITQPNTTKSDTFHVLKKKYDKRSPGVDPVLAAEADKKKVSPQTYHRTSNWGA